VFFVEYSRASQTNKQVELQLALFCNALVAVTAASLRSGSCPYGNNHQQPAVLYSIRFSSSPPSTYFLDHQMTTYSLSFLGKSGDSGCVPLECWFFSFPDYLRTFQHKHGQEPGWDGITTQKEIIKEYPRPGSGEFVSAHLFHSYILLTWFSRNDQALRCDGHRSIQLFAHHRPWRNARCGLAWRPRASL